MNFKHGYTGTKTFIIWASMKQRCNNPRNKHYKDYGGRGIQYDYAWEDFNIFLKDMGECPENYSLERIDVNGNYNKSNCKWIPFREQSHNRRDTVYVEIKGERISLRKWCRENNRPYTTIYQRIKKFNYSVEDALSIK